MTLNGNNVPTTERYNDDPFYLAARYDVLCPVGTGYFDEDFVPAVGAFARGYAEAMLWANTYTDDPETLGYESESDDNGYRAFESVNALYLFQSPGDWYAGIGIDFSDAIDFLANNYEALSLIVQANFRTYDGLGILRSDAIDYWERQGHDFALTRNHHGAGFLDRGYGPIGDALTDAAQIYGEANLYLDSEGNLFNE